MSGPTCAPFTSSCPAKKSERIRGRLSLRETALEMTRKISGLPKREMTINRLNSCRVNTCRLVQFIRAKPDNRNHSATVNEIYPPAEPDSFG